MEHVISTLNDFTVLFSEICRQASNENIHLSAKLQTIQHQLKYYSMETTLPLKRQLFPAELLPLF